MTEEKDQKKENGNVPLPRTIEELRAMRLPPEHMARIQGMVDALNAELRAVEQGDGDEHQHLATILRHVRKPGLDPLTKRAFYLTVMAQAFDRPR